MNIYVGNLSFEASQDELQQAFRQYGAVSSVSIICDRQTGRSRGFGFVEMPNNEEASAAIEGLNLQRIAGRAITVNEARERGDGAKRPVGGHDRRRW